MRHIKNILKLFLLLTAMIYGAGVRAQSVTPAEAPAGIIFTDTVQQIFVIMPQGTLELKPIELTVKAEVDADRYVAHITTNATGKRLTYTLYDAIGNERLSAAAEKETWDIDLSHLEAGIYMLHVSDGTRKQRCRIII